MEAVDCKTAGQLLSGAISPPINHYNHGESPHVNACVRNSNLSLAYLARTSCRSWMDINITVTNVTIDTEPPSATLCSFILERKASHSLT